MAPSTTVQVQLPESMIKEVKSRSSDSLSKGVRVMLARYSYLLKTEREGLRVIFTPEELWLLADANNGTIYYPETIQDFNANAEDTEDEKYEYFKVDRKVLMDKLGKLTQSQLHAMVDAIERFWEATSISSSTDPANLLND